MRQQDSQQLVDTVKIPIPFYVTEKLGLAWVDEGFYDDTLSINGVDFERIDARVYPRNSWAWYEPIPYRIVLKEAE